MGNYKLVTCSVSIVTFRLFTSHGLGVYHRILYHTHSPEPKSVIKDIHPLIYWHNLYLPCLMILGELLWQ